MTPSAPKVEALEDFTALPWCNALLSDPSITHISKRQIPDQRAGVSNTFFNHTLFTDGAIRAFLSMYRPGKGRKRKPGEPVFIGNAPTDASLPSYDEADEEKRQAAKVDKVFNVDDPDASECIMLASVGSDVEGGTQRLHGGVIATLLDQAMGTLVSLVYGYTSATTELTAKYKAAATTPCVLLCRAKLVREKGRWIEARGWVEDGQGKLYAEGSGAFIVNKVVTSKI